MMFCVKCGKENGDGTKFCKHCGNAFASSAQASNTVVESGAEVAQPNAAVQQNATAQPNAVVQQNTTVQQHTAPTNATTPGLDLNGIQGKLGGMFKNLGGDKSKFVKIGIAVAVPVIAVVAGLSIYNSDAMVLNRALIKTASAFEKESVAMLDKLPAYTYLKDWSKEQYSFTMESPGIAEGTLYTDIAGKKAQLDVEAFGEEVSLAISDSAITIESDLLDDVFGVNLDTLTEDLNDGDLFDINLPEDYKWNLFEVDTEITDKVEKLTRAGMIELAKGLTVEQVSDERVKVDGKTRELKTYMVTLPSEVVEDTLNGLLDDFFDDKKIIERLELELEVINEFNMAVSEYEYTGVTEIDIDDLRDAYEDVIDDFIDEYEREDMEDIEVLLSIYKGQIAQILVEEQDNVYYELKISLNAGGNLLDKITIADDYSKLEFSAVFEKDVLEISYKDNWDSFTFEYDTKDDRNNVKVSNAYETVSFTVDTTTKNELVFKCEIDGEKIEIQSKKGSKVDKNWFTQSKSFDNIATYTVEELQREMWKAISNAGFGFGF